MELDELKLGWEERDRKLDALLRLNKRLISAPALNKTETALKRLSHLLWLELAMALLAAFWIGSFLANHVLDARFLIPAGALQIGAIALLAIAIRQLVALSTIDYASPILGIQKRLESLRVERIRAATLTFLLAPLLWTPLLIVALKGLLGVDAYQALGITYLIANLVFGLLVIALAVWLSRRFAGRMARSPLVERVMRHLAGQSLATAAAHLESLGRFESDVSEP